MNLSQIFRGNFQSAYLGYFIGSEYAGRGYMGEALRLVLRHAFTTLDLHRLEANIQPGNAASLALAQRAGFARAGRCWRTPGAPAVGAPKSGLTPQDENEC